MKGQILADHIPVNKFDLIIAGAPPLTLTELSGIEDELETVDLPDRTVASGGNRKPFEFTAKMPAHHRGEQDYMELWFAQSQDPVLPAYKRPAVLVMKSISGNAIKSFTLIGLFPSKRATPDLEMANEGEMATIEWTFKGDNIIPIP